MRENVRSYGGSSACCLGGYELDELDPTYKLWKHDQTQGGGPSGTEVSRVAPGCWVIQKRLACGDPLTLRKLN